MRASDSHASSYRSCGHGPMLTADLSYHVAIPGVASSPYACRQPRHDVLPFSPGPGPHDPGPPPRRGRGRDGPCRRQPRSRACCRISGSHLRWAVAIWRPWPTLSAGAPQTPRCEACGAPAPRLTVGHDGRGAAGVLHDAVALQRERASGSAPTDATLPPFAGAAARRHASHDADRVLRGNKETE